MRRKPRWRKIMIINPRYKSMRRLKMIQKLRKKPRRKQLKQRKKPG
jgi:hypothetical protein